MYFSNLLFTFQDKMEEADGSTDENSSASRSMVATILESLPTISSLTSGYLLGNVVNGGRHVCEQHAPYNSRVGIIIKYN